MPAKPRDRRDENGWGEERNRVRWGDLAKQGCAVVIHGGQYGLNNNDGTPAERGSDGDYPEIDATIHEGTHTNTKKVQRDGQIRVSAAGTEGYPYIKFDNVKRVQIDGGRWRGEGGGLAVRDVVQGRRRGRAPLASETDLVGADLGQLPNLLEASEKLAKERQQLEQQQRETDATQLQLRERAEEQLKNRTSVARKGGPEAGDQRAGPAAEEPREISEAKEATAPAVLMRLAHDPELDQSEQVRSVQPAVGGEHKGDGQQLKRKATSGAAGRRKQKERRAAEEAKREASALAVAQRELLEASEKLAKERQQREQQQRETDATQLQLRERAEEQLKMEQQQRKRAEQQLQTEQELRERVRELEKHLADAFYPLEERVELRAAGIPAVVSADLEAGSCVLQAEGGEKVVAKEGEVVLGGNWTVLAVCAGGEVALERAWQRWSLLVLATAGGSRSLQLWKPLGDDVARINLTKYAKERLEKHLAEGEQREPQPWKQAERHGQHTVVFASGARYEGCWEADKRHGAENQARELEQHLYIN